MADAAAVQAMEALQSCRCCLRRPPDKGLKTLYENVGKTENYWDMLKECFNIHLNVGNDECGICEVCVARLRDATEFKVQVQQSQVELKALLEKALHEKDKKPSLIKVELFEEDPNVEEVMIQDDGPVKSEMGDGDIVSSVLFHVEATYEEDAWQQPQINESWQESESKTPYECQACQKKFDLEESLTRHIFAVHSKHEFPTNRRIYTCNFCCEWFTLQTELANHMEIHKEVDETKDLWCGVCEKLFSSKYVLKAHMIVHSGDKPHACEVCGKKFKYKHNASAHLKYHNDVENPLFSCGICAEEFIEKSDLKKHELVHKKKNIYSCETCKRRFKSNNHLKMHMAIHLEDRPRRPRRQEAQCHVSQRSLRRRTR